MCCGEASISGNTSVKSGPHKISQMLWVCSFTPNSTVHESWCALVAINPQLNTMVQRWSFVLNMWSTNTKLQLQYPLTNKAKRCLNFEEKTVFISLLLGLLLGRLHFRLHPPNVERFCLTCQPSVHEDVLDVTNIQDK